MSLLCVLVLLPTCELLVCVEESAWGCCFVLGLWVHWCPLGFVLLLCMFTVLFLWLGCLGLRLRKMSFLRLHILSDVSCGVFCAFLWVCAFSDDGVLVTPERRCVDVARFLCVLRCIPWL